MSKEDRRFVLKDRRGNMIGVNASHIAHCVEILDRDVLGAIHSGVERAHAKDIVLAAAWALANGAAHDPLTPLEVGDVVVAKMGGPRMTVVGILGPGALGGEGKPTDRIQIACIWFDGNINIKSCGFDECALVRVPEGT